VPKSERVPTDAPRPTQWGEGDTQRSGVRVRGVTRKTKTPSSAFGTFSPAKNAGEKDSRSKAVSQLPTGEISTDTLATSADEAMSGRFPFEQDPSQIDTDPTPVEPPSPRAKTRGEGDT